MHHVLPSPRQMEFQSWERGVFLHFGIRTFYEGFRDMDARAMSPERFAPASLDCASWAETARKAGFRYMVMTAKHHDGYALWPSRTTGFSVASSPWKGGKGDVVREFLEGCRRHGVKTGLYYSPYDHTSPAYTDEKAYDDYFVAQISEILEPYGEIDILWFDGCGSEGHEYDWPRIVGEIRRMQPNVLIFNMGDPDFRWIGNEDGYAPLGTRNVVDAVPFSVRTEEAEEVATRKWLPAECDCRMRERNWFFSDADGHTVKTLDELMGIYYLSCGRGCNLLLNIGPDRRGLLPDADAARLVEFGREIERRFSSPVARLADCTRDGNRWEFRSEETLRFDHVVVKEDTSKGERIARFAVKVPMGNAPVTVFEGRTVGCRAIGRFPTVRARRIVFEVEESDGDPELAALEFHCAGG